MSTSDPISFEYRSIQITSNQLASINPLRENQPKLAKLQKYLARKTKFSRNWHKQKTKSSKLPSKIANIRNATLKQELTELANSRVSNVGILAL